MKTRVLRLDLILLVGVCSSAYLLFTQSIRLDEAQQISMSTKPVLNIIQLIAQDVHVPLYAILVHFWIQVFGTDITAVRTLSFLFFLATLPVLFTMTKESSEDSMPDIAVSLFALSPFIMWYTFEARMYTLFVLVTCLSHLYFLRLVRQGGRSSEIRFTLTTLVGLYTHYFYHLVLLTQFVYLAIYTWKRKPQPAAAFKTFMSSAVTAYVFFVPWIVYVLYRGTVSNTMPLIPPPTSYNIFQTFIQFLFGFQNPLIQTVIVSMWPLAIAVLFYAFTRTNRRPLSNPMYFLASVFLPVLAAFFISYFRPVFLSRYLIFVTPPLFVIIAWMLAGGTTRLFGGGATVLLLIMFAFLLNQGISSYTPVKEDYKGVSEYLSQTATPQDIVAVSAPFTVYPIEYMYTGKSHIVTIPEWDRYEAGPIPAYSDTALQKQMSRYQKQYADIFLVLSYDQGYESRVRRYFDKHYQLLDHKQFSPGLEARKYKLRYDEPAD